MARRKRTGSSSGSGRQSKPQSAAAARPGGQKRSGKSIVNQRQTPWGLIVATVLIVVFAVGIVGYAVAQGGNGDNDGRTGAQPRLAETEQIDGVSYKSEPAREHAQGVVDYDSAPPVGGTHSQYWADCSGTVYGQAIANENAVHMLEHGAVWITYNAETLPTEQLDTLKKLVNGVDRMALSPYPDLNSPISLQTWGYQLFVDNAADRRIEQFINTLRYNPKATPEFGATCAQPSFKQAPSTFGNPLWLPAEGGSANTHP